jgi:branched-chain amino acid transport system permease protein
VPDPFAREGRLVLMMLPQLLVSGIAAGTLYALIALSMTVVYRATTVVNFGHGDLVMAGAYATLVFLTSLSLPFLPALVLSLVLLFGMGALLERFLIRPILYGPHLALAMMALAAGYAVRGAARLEWGQEVMNLPRPYAQQFYLIRDVVVTLDELVISATVLGLLMVLFVVFHLTRWGKVVQAIFQTQRGAALVGINVNAYQMGVWGAGAALGALGGILLALITPMTPDLGVWTLVRGFAAMTLGGFGSLHGAVIGGLILGVLEKLLGFYVSTAFIDITAYVVTIVVLLVRPRGLFGQHATLRI